MGDIEQEPFPALLREGIEEAEISVKELARRLSAHSGATVESERRALQRYLKGEVTPERDKAAAIGRALGRPEAIYVKSASLQVSIQELMLDIANRVETLAAEFKASDQRLRGARAQNRVVDRLEALEGRLEEQGKEMTKALRALAKEVRALAPEQGSSGRSASRQRGRS